MENWMPAVVAASVSFFALWFGRYDRGAEIHQELRECAKGKRYVSIDNVDYVLVRHDRYHVMQSQAKAWQDNRGELQ